MLYIAVVEKENSQCWKKHRYKAKVTQQAPFCCYCKRGALWSKARKQAHPGGICVLSFHSDLGGDSSNESSASQSDTADWLVLAWRRRVWWWSARMPRDVSRCVHESFIRWRSWWKLALGRIAICDREKSFFHCESIVTIKTLSEAWNGDSA